MNAVRFYTRNGNGERQPIGGIDELTARLSAGTLGGDSELYDELVQKWGFVRDHDVFISMARAGSDFGLAGLVGKALSFSGLRLVLTAALLLVAVVALSPTGNVLSDIGYALGASALGAVLSWPLLRSSSTRRGVGALVFLGVGILSLWNGASQNASRRRAAVSEKLAALRATIDSSSTDQTGASGSGSDSNFTSSGIVERGGSKVLTTLSPAQVNDVGRVAPVMSEVKVAIESLGKSIALSRFGVDIDVAPPEWMEVHYIANASQFPNVGAYWERYGQYLDFWTKQGGRLTDSILSSAMDRAGVSEAFAVEVRTGAAKAFVKDLPAYGIASRTMRTALGLHRALVEYDEELSIGPDGKQWVYKSDYTYLVIRRRMALLQAQSDSMTKAFAARQADRAQQLKMIEKAIR